MLVEVMEHALILSKMKKKKKNDKIDNDNKELFQSRLVILILPYLIKYFTKCTALLLLIKS